ncbi:DUF2656 domain-containing protein [bacterium]|nr:DUF2656 domain-containing protein [bacterium]
MTTFVLSHNLQVQSDLVPALNFELLAQELKSLSKNISSTEVLGHPHWKLSIASDLSPQDMAVDLVQTWSEYRRQLGHDMNHVVLALGGRKDSQASPGAPLQKGYWGVDLVETPDESTFLHAINWEALKAGRSEDAIFEVSSRAS